MVMLHDHDVAFGEAGAHFELRHALALGREWSGYGDAIDFGWLYLRHFKRQGKRFGRERSRSVLARNLCLLNGGGEPSVFDNTTGRIAQQAAESDKYARHARPFAAG